MSAIEKNASKSCEPIEKILHLRTRKGGYVKVLREIYLRPQLPCLSAACRECPPSSCHLPAEATHYIIPAVDVVCNYLDLLELPEMVGILFTQTAVTVTYRIVRIV